MKKLWFRVGTMIEFTDEDYTRIINGGIVPRDILDAIKEGRAVPNGETYAPMEDDLPYETEINVSL